jgi:hypothetical protein
MRREFPVSPLTGFFAILDSISDRFRGGLRCFVPPGLLATPQLVSCELGHRLGVRSQGEYTMRSTMIEPQKKTRRQMLEEFVAAKPEDAFARYGLAMECANSGDAAAADTHFKAILASHPDYVAAYFQYGQFLGRTGRTEEARATLAAGVATATRTGNEHARSEMAAALADLG